MASLTSFMDFGLVLNNDAFMIMGSGMPYLKSIVKVLVASSTAGCVIQLC